LASATPSATTAWATEYLEPLTYLLLLKRAYEYSGELATATRKFRSNVKRKPLGSGRAAAAGVKARLTEIAGVH